MVKTEPKKIKTGFPLREYLKQLFFSSSYVSILNPIKFWRTYRMEHLESCWDRDWVRLFRRCWIKQWKPDVPRQLNQIRVRPIVLTRSHPTVKYHGVPWKKQRGVIFRGSQSLKRKNRNVLYHPREGTVFDISPKIEAKLVNIFKFNHNLSSLCLNTNKKPNKLPKTV